MLTCLLLMVSVSGAPGSREPVTDIFESDILQKLDQPDLFAFATVAGSAVSAGKAAEPLPQMRLADLYRHSARYRSLADLLEADMREIKRKAKIPMAESAVEAEALAKYGNAARHFDWRWLKSAKAALALVAVVNRMDRMDFAGGCGEIRLIYRLACREKGKEERYSEMPFFLNVILEYKQKDCRAIARLWFTGGKSFEALIGGPLAPAQFSLRQVEVNLQAVRFPSGQKKDFGGQAIYLFRIFRDRGPDFVPVALENTPDVSQIRKDAGLRRDLIAQLTDAGNLSQIDEGTFNLKNTDGRLLATKALSFSTTGRSRLANKPFTALAVEAEINPGIFAGTKFIATPQGFVERLNAMSCMGCHQSNGTAGFHVLGTSAERNSSFNRIVLPFSPHFYAERERRRAYLKALAAGEQPVRFRQHPVYPAAEWSGRGPLFEKIPVRGLCVPGIDFKQRAVCEPSAECRVTANNPKLAVAIGECVQKISRADNLLAGAVCREGIVENAALSGDASLPFNFFSFNDAFKNVSGRDLPGHLYAKSPALSKIPCGRTAGGVPLGRVSKKCANEDAGANFDFADKPGAVIPKEICAVGGGVQFDVCAAGANPLACISETPVNRIMLDTCSLGQFCREDYICQRLPEEIAFAYPPVERRRIFARIGKISRAGTGFCTPNYFLFNMRVDGHTSP